MKQHPDDALIDVSSRETLGDRRPILIAHRGGFLGPNAPENSAASIRLANDHGYDMVELDVREAGDGVPVLYHDRTMGRHTGRDGQVEDFSSEELARIVYLGSNQRILTLAQALELCRELRLGVMFDVKAPGDTYCDGFFDEINRLIDANGLRRACVVINGDDRVQEGLRERCRIRIEDDLMSEIMGGARPDLSGHFWFAMRGQLPDDGAVATMQGLGALVTPAMNTFRYPAHAFMELARRDIADCLELDVDGFQIDSVYTDFFSAGFEERYGR